MRFLALALLSTSALAAEPSAQEQRLETIESEIATQQGLANELHQQQVELQLESDRSSIAGDPNAQAADIQQTIVVDQLKEQLVRQRAAVAGLESTVRQHDLSNIDAESFDLDRQELARQSQILNNLVNEYYSAQAEASASRNQRAAQATEDAVNRSVASQNLDRQSAQTQATIEKLQSDAYDLREQINRNQNRPSQPDTGR